MLGEKLRKLKDMYIRNFLEFFQNTSIHGLRYVGSSNFCTFQRIFFAISFIAICFLASVFITKTYEKWVKNPTIVGINPKPTFIVNEPFPAVTICNMNHIQKSRVEHTYTQLSNDSEEYAKLQFFCNIPEEFSAYGKTYTEPELTGFLENVSQPCSGMIKFCRFGGVVQNCSEIFNFIVTSQGGCCVFNMLHPKFMYVSRVPPTLKNFISGSLVPVNWSAEYGYETHLPLNFFPRMTRGTGESVGFTLLLDLEGNNYYCASGYSKGFKILLHSPNETPNVFETGLLLNSGRQTKIRIRPEKTETHPNLRNINWRYRYCFFQDEYKLKYFAHYTQRNCEMECIARVMWKHCHCITFYLPLIEENIPICGVEKTPCVDRVRMRTDGLIEYCLSECLPGCNDFIFYGDVSTATLLNVDPDISSRNYSVEYLQQNVAVVNMFFKEFFFRSSIQNEFLGTADLMSNIGGIMGLCIGFSFISVLEIFYYIFLRPLQNLLRNKVESTTNIAFRHSNKSVKVQEVQRKYFNLRRNQIKQRLWLEFARYSLRRKSAMKTRRRNCRNSRQMLAEILESV